MRFIGYVLLLFLIGIVVAFLNLIEGIYYGLAVPTLGSIKIANVSVKLPIWVAFSQYFNYVYEYHEDDYSY